MTIYGQNKKKKKKKKKKNLKRLRKHEYRYISSGPKDLSSCSNNDLRMTFDFGTLPHSQICVLVIVAIF